MTLRKLFVLLFLWLTVCCSENVVIIDASDAKNLTIFFVNDMHGELVNFARMKYIVDQEKATTNVLVASGGDIFSGNPVVDNHPQKGLPIIDIMNRVGFNVSVLGNHEFDYGPEILKDRMNQAEFSWVCANVDMSSSGVPEPLEFKTFDLDGFRVTFLGLIETSGRGNIPLTHPWRVRNIDFKRPETVVAQYERLKEQEQSDLFIALTHLGHDGQDGVLGDFQLAEQFPFFDLIIGGHSNELLNTNVNNIPVFQAGNDLNYLGKIKLTIVNKKIQSLKHELINLNTFANSDAALVSVISDYQHSVPELEDVIGYSNLDHERFQVGCFYTDALRIQLNADISFQNSGGVRASLDQGDITKREIYEIDPFNNGTITYTMSVAGIKDFLEKSRSSLYYSGVIIDQVGNDVIITDLGGNVLADNTPLTVGINDFIPAIFEDLFPESGVTSTATTAETIISFLEENDEKVDYPDCSRFFKYE